ncbi:SNAP-25 (synaptosome-associated protein) component of SNARE complex [Ceraceosorus bombacis]|uniref:SNAP-25 (Synaptosome-associated protein) component of SNARE complex n=1 Tax=Ceraceosorus bombacis TaxID=401625 RepID=A0A0P1BIE1_9BASI|nr:SNAP-25 (synaptosome-associated protein) component of SNARE complex [Ceraceosorus bombacis]
MPLFKKSSSNKIPPPPEVDPVNGPFKGGYYGAPPGSTGGAAGGAGYRGGPPQAGGPGAPAGRYGGPQPGGYGGAAGYNQGGAGAAGYGRDAYAPPQDRFAGARAPSSNLGSDFDRMYGSNRNQAYSGARSGAGRDDASELEAEYGAGSGGYQQQEYQEEARQRTAEEEEEEEVEAVKQQMRFTKQESLSSTRNALRIAREAEETASGTILRLGQQSDQIANTERHLDMAKAHSSRADDNAKEMMRLNRSIFRPNVGFNKEAKRNAEEARILNRHIEEREEREATRAEALRAQNRMDQSLGGPGSGRFGKFAADRFGGGKSAASREEEAKKNKLAQRSRYQFEATGSDDELEDELDNNLDEIGQLSGRLNQLGRAMGTEIDDQNSRIRRLGDKTSALDTKVFNSTQRLDRIK